MHEFAFYLEYADGRFPQQYKSPDEVIRAKNIQVALRRLARKKKMKLSGWEQLDGAGYRAFYINRRKEWIYYVSIYPKRT